MTRQSKRLAASEESTKLFCALEDFVNLGDGLSELDKFRSKWPCFFPADVYEFCRKQVVERPQRIRVINVDGPSSMVPNTDSGHFLTAFRDWLREIWRGEQDTCLTEDLSVMLGLQEDWRSEYSQMGCELPLARGGLDWRTGRFLYEPECEFQAALYAIVLNSWKAKVCSHCSRFFVADKPAQLYCSTRCAGEAKRARGQEWWREHGSHWRKHQKQRTKRRTVRESNTMKRAQK